jgi:hypothetical protein
MREIKLKWVKDVGQKLIGGKRNYLVAIFTCPICNNNVEKIKKDGMVAKFCSHACYAVNRGLRGAYKGGQVLISGYLYTYSPTHPNRTNNGYVASHRLIAERSEGRYLTEDEVAHHKNENKLDNRPENIEVMTKSQHSKHHQNFRKCKIVS